MAESFTYPFKVKENANYKKALEGLNTKIDAIKKQVSYFDFYNITDVVIDVKSFAAQLNTLPFNQGLVINTSPFYYNGENYTTGDVVLKSNTGSIYHIKAQTGGVYYPSKLTKDSTGTYTIEYSYADSSPTAEGETFELVDGKVEADFRTKITFSGLSENNNNTTNIYGESGILENGYFSFNVQQDSSSNDIKPFVQFFLVDGDIPIEQIFIDYTLEVVIDNNVRKWKITPSLDSSDNVSLIYVKVK